MHANAILRDRKRVSTKIELDWYAVPPTNAITELQQLSAWNKWIRYEMTNPDNLNTDQHNTMMKLVFEQCLCCMLHHPEVWMTYARFQQQLGGVTEARRVYREAIETVPEVVSLRLALAELEECQGSKDMSRMILKTAFDKIPCGFSFSALQRYIRRRDGISGARKLFSDTIVIRKDPLREALGLEICISHAQLELEINCNPKIALKVLDMARISYINASNDIRFVKMLSHVLTLLGDLKQIRWIFQTVLGEHLYVYIDVCICICI